ncbi:Bax inhibitor-1/YccA family protein [Algicella marina]|uniref:BAX inhibitor (BI)-1/YccA family protein n=1 Tax=Algicella marina TaxID=2683284 RepID=A0A6P1T1F7_9RHOB|nr:Bax inhibitor-1/YccA family protein [Algicella marina]QHQ35595.1 BAX inhibitor (BI)-1/YccA family protein [Algicella marina]
MAEFGTIRRAGSGVRTAEIDVGLRAHMNKVYGLMSIAMVVTGAVAWVFGTDAANFVNNRPTGLIPAAMIEAIYFSPLRWVIMFAPLVMVFAMGAMVNRLSESALQFFFYSFSAVMGLSISWIFAVFTGMSIAQTFFITAIAFAGLSLWGYTTKKDISGWGSFLIMGVIGLIVASIVNIFLQSPAVMFAISGLGVLIFAGLTAYDTQKIKNDYLMMRSQGGEAYLGKAAIMGALSLYLDFINLFMFLLQFLGNRE